jgi:hypothetical protein
MRRLGLVIAAVATLAVPTAGCGGGGGEDSTTTAAETTEAAALSRKS